ncbi:iron-hydroxamate ABC transporter substrate-binding protein [Thermoactinomyces intermedius]|jgi:iron complex transport system substrate-binding protein|uniref:Iron-hydroxamate ABC transporter substrate-binding protein n=1 Tax=Thermoactinomyces intermedius TaxID=2024 RepID=A0A8I1A687_THEIN|nr:iron-hydroxamate ABC transporter substrate-binding protein [Thermoactinomyces intermedius]MBA4548394.1 iron-hydroxamate ABC transporter substrate-binding protein [Thermoactinomyces intermedius]MBA4837483.1 iron-hydroxamate ABC transporter substrate-binding protein [Thermoactinomyces intermedius]MBH8595238.1 iron-hydroxamate ABC transporter substrate-binding protein [Thermoactinomyces intermedius]
MKKIWPLLLGLALFLSGCGGSADESATNGSSKTVTYQSENGPVEVPEHPKRIVVLSQFAGNVMALGGNIVGVDSWAKDNPRFKDKLKNAEVVSDEDLEKIIELNPDLIIGVSTTKNVDKLKQIAPTVTYTYGKLDYLTQHLEIGKLLNKEEEARKWIDQFKAEAKKTGEEIKAKIGEDATVSVIENFDKQLYVFGDNWGRGTEILYQEMGLKMPPKVKEKALGPGYYAISPEVLRDFAGDYVIFSKYKDADTSFEKTETYQNIPAVKNHRVFEVDARGFFFNDPLTLEYQLDFFKKSFLNQ